MGLVIKSASRRLRKHQINRGSGCWINIKFERIGGYPLSKEHKVWLSNLDSILVWEGATPYSFGKYLKEKGESLMRLSEEILARERVLDEEKKLREYTKSERAALKSAKALQKKYQAIDRQRIRIGSSMIFALYCRSKKQ